jgi:hypothetical protein
VPYLNKGSMEILFREFIHIHIRKHFGGGHIPGYAQFKVFIFEHAWFKLIVQEGRMADTFLVILSSGHGTHFLFFFLFFYSHVHTLFGPFLPMPVPPPSCPFPHQFQAGPVLPLLLVLLKKSDKPNKEDKVFLLVELRIAMQKYS